MTTTTCARAREKDEPATPDRSASEPGGCECIDCGRTFIGAQWHTKCGLCHYWEQRHRATDLESRALSMLTDDQAMASFHRWRTGHAEIVARSLRDRLGVEEYIAAIYRSVPA